jgi:hypothetical protein
LDKVYPHKFNKGWIAVTITGDNTFPPFYMESWTIHKYDNHVDGKKKKKRKCQFGI